MRLQNLLVIFVIIALPVIIILSVFVNYQIDTARLKSTYSSKLIDATYDTVAAFQLNINNNKYSTVSDSLMEDIQASTNIFAKTLASNLGVIGSKQSQVMTYIPAILFTLYDGYYIYTPVAKEDQTYEVFEHELKPYVYYTKTYAGGTNKILTINYSLDNYVAVYYYDNGHSYQSRAGYLEVPSDTNQEGTRYKGYTIEDADAQAYYKEAYDFTKWFNDIVKDFGNSDVYENLYIDEDNSPLQGEASAFNDEKVNVIETSITNNLMQAMKVYGKYAGKDFQLPELNGEDWDTILNNICVVSFMQGLPVGTTLFSDYAIIPSTDNSKYVNDNTLYFIGSNDPNTYHRIGCEELKGDITGYNRADFKLKQLEEDGTITYTYNNASQACYYCMVRASEASLPETYNNETEKRNREKAYYTALAREKHKLIKISDYINNSDKITK